MIVINRWYGRLGNNIFQVQNALFVALFHCHEMIQIPKHPYFNKTIIHLSVERKCLNNIQGTFYFRKKIKNIDMCCFEQNCGKVKEILSNLFSMKNIVQDLGENDIVIHLRSGDIFRKRNGAPAYIIPPLSFFISLLEKLPNKEKIIVLAEDDRNPILGELQKRYPKLEWKKQSLEEDIEILLGAKNVIESFGTFTPSLLLLSKNIKNIYRSSYQANLKKEFFPNVNIEIVDLEEYRNLMYPWKNTKEQIKKMLEYK